MVVGVPKEIKDKEFRVALTPVGARILCRAGQEVLVEAGAGLGSGFADDEYLAAGAHILPDATSIYGSAGMVLKVKEPLPQEYAILQEGSIIFTFLHLAADAELAHVLLKKNITAIASETVQLADGHLPILAPMSAIAGKISVQVGAHYLEKVNGGAGKLLGSVPGVRPAEVVVLGAGAVGSSAAAVALGMGAQVTLIDVNIEKLGVLTEVLRGNLVTLASNEPNIAEAVQRADLVIGAVLIPGARAPRLVTREMVAGMEKGSVVVDVSVDQGGCIETCHPTSHSDPVYYVDGVLHYCVTNMPAAVPQTSTPALVNGTLPYVQKIATHGLIGAVLEDHSLAHGLNTYRGHVVHPAVAQALALEYTPLEGLLERDLSAKIGP